MSAVAFRDYVDPQLVSAAEAKRQCRAKHGRLPRIGYEMVVNEGVEDGQRFTVYLANEGGRFRVWVWREVMTLDWYQRRGRI